MFHDALIKTSQIVSKYEQEDNLAFSFKIFSIFDIRMIFHVDVNEDNIIKCPFCYDTGTFPHMDTDIKSKILFLGVVMIDDIWIKCIVDTK